MRRRAVLLAALLLPALSARAEAPQAAPVVSGMWTATNQGGQIFAGTWSAEIAAATPNDAVGSWTLTNETGSALMQGTWSARKTRGGWRGIWSARVAPAGGVFSGTWGADDRTLKGAKTFEDMLRRTADAQIAGIWKMGRAHGNWWLRARR